MNFKRFFVKDRSPAFIVAQVIIVLMFIFALIFFLWSIMRYNEIMEEKQKNEEYIQKLSEEVEELEYLVNAPLDDAYKIRIARDRLGMCFPNEIIFHTELN